MSSKSDSDNRSNQLNPNNDAYYSSRGGRNDDDDDSFQSNRSAGQVFADWAYEEKRRHEKIQDSMPVREIFTFDFLSLNGIKAHMKATAELPNRLYSTNRISDCTDLIDMMYPQFVRRFTDIAGFPIAYSQVRDDKGTVLIWLRIEYLPRDRWSHEETQAQKDLREQYNAMWEKSGKAMVAEFKASLVANDAIHREDLGMVVTPQNANAVWVDTE